MIEERITRQGDAVVVPQPWGRLEWTVSGEQENSTTMTVGTCFIAPGEQNPRHFHPNCDEVLRVVGGVIEHSLDGESTLMREGDVISIPQGSVHNARNIGDEQVELAIIFSNAHREVVGE